MAPKRKANPNKNGGKTLNAVDETLSSDNELPQISKVQTNNSLTSQLQQQQQLSFQLQQQQQFNQELQQKLNNLESD